MSSDSSDSVDSLDSSNSPAPSTGPKEVKPDGIKSSYYHFKSTPAEEAARYAPKPIDASSAAAAPKPAGGSAWNAAGTWEEKDLTSWAHERLKEILPTVEIPAHSDCRATINSVTKVTGDVTVIFSRGKKRPGYDLTISCDWSGEFKSAQGKGTIEIHGLDETCDGDYEIGVFYNSESSDKEASGKLATLVKRAVPDIKKKIELFLQELKEQ